MLLVVTTKRVFMCTAGTCGFCGCAISEMPEAQKRGSSLAPGISLRNSGANSPNTVEQCTPTFSNTRPRITDITPPPPSGSALADPALEVPISGKPEIGCWPVWSLRDQGVRTNRPAARSPSGAFAGSASSRASRAAQMSSRRLSNQARARDCWESRSVAVMGLALIRCAGRCYHRANPPVCRSASPATMAAAIATLSERRPSRSGMRRQVSAAHCTASGTPALSRPNSSTSSAR